MARRSPESFADYLAVAACPALIMFLVGSLVFFLIEVFYQGQYQGRLLVVMGLFVMAIVCIARISIEQDAGYASLFALPLAGVVLLAMSYLVKIEGPLASIGLIVNMLFMGIVWWSAHKLTWDCTVIDDSIEASGQGLLQEMGLDPSTPPGAVAAPGVSTRPGDLTAVTTTEPIRERPWWERILEPDRRPHAPGVWVVYFSLAALPLFGFGGWFVPSSDLAARGRAFQWLVVYVGSGLALLLATSFLGLRRYLRQRRLEMPLEMTATWVTLGAGLIGATLLVAAILPRPRAEYSLTQLPIALTSAVRRASQFAAGKEGTEDKSPDRATTTEVQKEQRPEQQGSHRNQQAAGTAESEQGKESSAGGGRGKSKGGQAKSSADKKQPAASDTPADGKTSEQQANDAEAIEQSQGDKKKNDGDKGNGNNSKGGPSEQPADQEKGRPAAGQRASQISASALQGVHRLLGWLLYGALVAAAIAFGWIYRAELSGAWNKLLAELRELWNQWFGGRTAEPAISAAAAPLPPPRAFASYADPFLSGAAGRMSWQELVRYTFEATESWGRERGLPRAAGQTPHEFAVALVLVEPALASPMPTLAAWYSQLAYAPRTASRGPVEALQRLWQVLRASAPPPVSATKIS